MKIAVFWRKRASLFLCFFLGGFLCFSLGGVQKALAIDAAVAWTSKKAYFFNGEYYYRWDVEKNRVDEGYPRKITDRNWPGLWKSGIDAATNWGNGKVYFFKGGDYIKWDIKTDSMDQGYPKKIARRWKGLSKLKDFTSDFDAVVNWGNGKAYIFKGNRYVRWNIKASRLDSGYPKQINSKTWNGLWSKNIGASFLLKDRKIYLFRDNEYILWDKNTDQASSGYPKKISDENWMGLRRKGSDQLPDELEDRAITKKTLTKSNHRFQIRFDYRFAQGFFDTPAKRAPLEFAAKLWGELIASDFSEVPAGTEITVTHPQTNEKHTVTLEEPIDDLLIFVFAYPFGSSSKAVGGPFGSWTIGGELDRRYNGSKFQPWVGKLRFNTEGGRPWFFDQTPYNSHDLPSKTHYDIFSTTLHEVGHVLGFLLSIYESTGNLGKNDTFIGNKAMEWNHGQPIPLAHESSHISRKMEKGLLRPNLDEHLMHAVSPIQGFRFLPTVLDLKMLEDIGYQIRWESLPIPDDYPRRDDPRSATYREGKSRRANTSQDPVGLWRFDNPEYLKNAIIGAPLKYMPTSNPTQEIQVQSVVGGIRVPNEAYFIVDHGIESSSTGKCVNQYSLLYDIRLPQAGADYSLYNTNINNANDGEAWVNKQGKLGQGNYSSLQMKPQTWYRVLLTVDTSKNRRVYYIDGKKALEQKAGKVDGRFSFNTPACGHPLFLLFADNDGEGATIDAKQVALYDYELSPQQAKKLGNYQTDLFGQ